MVDHVKEKDTLRWSSGPVSNTAFGVIGGSLGAAAAAGLGPIILPFAVLGGVAGFLMSGETSED